ncbi:ATP-binding response regulator [Cupriavidus agavae]|uniref:histidine kinase n=1 Tax=Cupriavidus agavae TaxID=1001822 RepID=A0A4Q7RW00_9BURK|nr:ATP-binding protein [Cupriavidus agavae]RZT36830.1 PAS domain S-box-containing protein [Cupriavidus agavae]
MREYSILVVEDDRIVARDIAQQLTKEGYQVIGMVSTGEEALDVCEQTVPDLVLMDLRLAGKLDGIEVATRLRNGKIPVVFLTAYADRETVRRATLAEPFGYLIKPFEDAQLRSVVQMALYKHAAEERLRESESCLAATLSSIGDAVIATDREGRVVFMNPAAEAMTGWQSLGARGKSVAEVFGEFRSEMGAVQRLVDDAVESATVGDQGTETSLTQRVFGRAELVRKDGREYTLDYRASPILSDKRTSSGAVLVFRDITSNLAVESALRSAQEELERVSRVMTMGELTASIAHEITQPLTGVINYASAGLNFLRRDPPDLAEVRDILVSIVKDGRRAADVVDSLRALARKSRPNVSTFDLNDMVRDVIGLTKRDVERSGTRLVIALTPQPCPVAADLIQMRQVLLNLVRNAVEAMTETEREVRLLRVTSSRTAGGRIQVTVEDNGPGLTGEPARIFEPFYTTKEGGMGMGLSICRSIVDAHDGHLTGTTSPSGGAAFSFELPMARGSDGTA